MKLSSEFLELFFKSSAIFIVSIPGVFHVTQKHLAALRPDTYRCFVLTLVCVVPDLNLTCRNSTRKDSPNMFLMRLRRAQYWARLSHQNVSIHILNTCVVFRNLCDRYFLGPKCLIWIFHVFSMQRSCNPACPDLKYEHTSGDDLWIWGFVDVERFFYLYLKYLSKNFTFSVWVLCTPQFRVTGVTEVHRPQGLQELALSSSTHKDKN